MCYRVRRSATIGMCLYPETKFERSRAGAPACRNPVKRVRSSVNRIRSATRATV